jgi:hypothetical protein
MDFVLRIHVDPEMQISLASQIERTEWRPFVPPNLLSDITSVRKLKFLKGEEGYQKFDRLWKETGVCAVIAKTDDAKYEEQNMMVLIPNYRVNGNKFKCDIYLVPETGVLSDAIKHMGNGEFLETMFPIDVTHIFRVRLYQKVLLISHPELNCDKNSAQQRWNDLVEPGWAPGRSEISKVLHF